LQRLSSPVNHFEWLVPSDTMAHSFQNEGFDPKHPRIDLPRHLDQHSEGMVIWIHIQRSRCLAPERASMPERTVVQSDKEDCTHLGFIKADLLGLGMMAVLKNCLELIPKHYGDRVDLAQLPVDGEVYRTLQRADTLACL
jgi:error-prone DNA polymerase